MSLEELAHWRHPLATLLTSAVIVAIVIKLSQPLPKPPPPEPLTINIKLVAAIAPPSPPKPIVPQPTPAKPQPQAVEHTAPKRTPLHEHTPRPEATPPNSEANVPVGPATPPAPPAPATQAPPSPPPAAAAIDHAGIEAAYRQKALAEVEHQKRYPMSKDARLQRPEGTVTVVFTLTREGTLLDAEVETSAGSILDEQALVTVRKGHYPPFPKEAWPGEAQHRFRVEIKFAPP